MFRTQKETREAKKKDGGDKKINWRLVPHHIELHVGIKMSESQTKAGNQRKFEKN